jgi:hypothetical protein
MGVEWSETRGLCTRLKTRTMSLEDRDLEDESSCRTRPQYNDYEESAHSVDVKFLRLVKGLFGFHPCTPQKAT